jgi:DNA-binding transcriptional regulator YiaG
VRVFRRLDMKYKSEIYEVIHQDGTALFEIGAMSEAEMRELNELCLDKEPAPEYKAEKSLEVEFAPA